MFLQAFEKFNETKYSWLYSWDRAMYWYTAKMENETKKTIYEITKGGVMYSQKGAATTNDNVALQTV